MKKSSFSQSEKHSLAKYDSRGFIGPAGSATTRPFVEIRTGVDSFIALYEPVRELCLGRHVAERHALVCKEAHGTRAEAEIPSVRRICKK
jgi:hypothetical protein